ncbi:unnamed protein product [Plutella xylostella]|uniref:Hexosyltransferase n=1 Tax=Plutella xylostella TaxID=51655 RepID=A0A8S4G0Q0_PLUXY|nr:unnamed protein product [Plutella xylostella]
MYLTHCSLEPEWTREMFSMGHTRAHPELCPARGAGVRLLVLVLSARGHAARRQAVRLTWGHAGRRRDLRLAFLVGLPARPAPPAAAAAAAAWTTRDEDALYGDVIEANVSDAPQHRGLRALSMLEWALRHCALAQTLLKVDDDVFVHVVNMLRLAAAGGAGGVRGYLLRGAPAARAPGHPLYVSSAQLPGEWLPPHALPHCYLVGAAAWRPLLRAAWTARPVPPDQLLVTGLLAARAGLARHHEPALWPRADAANFSRALCLAAAGLKAQLHMWERMVLEAAQTEDTHIDTYPYPYL